MVDFWDTEEMANKILGILKYMPLKKEMSKNAFAEAFGITWEKIADNTMRVYSMAGGAA